MISGELIVTLGDEVREPRPERLGVGVGLDEERVARMPPHAPDARAAEWCVSPKGAARGSASRH